MSPACDRPCSAHPPAGRRLLVAACGRTVAAVLGMVALLCAVAACTASPAGLGGRSTSPDGLGGAPSTPPDGLARVDWTRYVRDCSVADGGSGLGTIVDAVQDVDVTGDGRAEALVVSRCESRTSSWPQEIEVFDGASQRQAPVRIGRLLADDPAYPREVNPSVDGTSIVVDAIGLSPDAPTCCPDLLLHRVFTWTGSAFTLTESTATPR